MKMHVKLRKEPEIGLDLQEGTSGTVDEVGVGGRNYKIRGGRPLAAEQQMPRLYSESFRF